MTRPRLILGISVLLAAAVAFVAPPAAHAQAGMPLNQLLQSTHIHGLAVDRADSGRLLVATHHGLHALRLDTATVEPVSERRDDFMGFTPHPVDASILFASGHPATGGNLGVIKSSDGGRSWSKIADGVGGPVDFHQLDVSRSSPNVLYGGYNGLQRSDDAGRTWRTVGPLPPDTFDLAVSPTDSEVVYAATRTGLLRGDAGGTRWAAEFAAGQTATMVHASNGALYAFVVGVGLARRSPTDPEWDVLTTQVQGGYVLHLTVGTGIDPKMYAATHDPKTGLQSISVSVDGGVRWSSLSVR
ncbi:MAG: WD40/YVTN/BNR-like repeat-containing protein [Alphaproteobacteria bacterium]